MMWLAAGVTLVVLVLLGLAIRYARSDAWRKSDADSAQRAAKVTSIMARPDDTATSLDALRERYAARERRRRMRDED